MRVQNEARLTFGLSLLAAQAALFALQVAPVPQESAFADEEKEKKNTAKKNIAVRPKLLILIFFKNIVLQN
jgi:hypothetical protein